jgi:ABC-type sugar transport system ATPase subunit
LRILEICNQYTVHIPEKILLSARAVAKNFGVIPVLTSVNLDLRAGEIHALFGANGAGKSTLSKIICGHLSLSSGSLILEGQQKHFSSPRDAIDAGIGIVTQETSLAKELPVWENIILPLYAGTRKYSRTELRHKAGATLHRLGFTEDIPIDIQCGNLSSAQRQLVEIARIVCLESRIIILDEPTAALSPGESARLFKVMESLRKAGHGLIFVSHRLEEIFAITDRITVLRDGRSVESGVETANLTQAKLIQLMVGREVDALRAEHIPDTSRQKILLRATGVKALEAVQGINLEIRSGEIVGLGGLVGSGRSEFAEVLMGLRKISAGEIELLGQSYQPTSPKSAIALGLGYLPEDRRLQSIIPDFSVRENILLGHLSQLNGHRLGYHVHDKRITELASHIELAEHRLDDSSLLNFSGGMQQKALLIRALLLEPKVLILDEPTRGVDVGSRSVIYALLRELVAKGMAILLISSDFEELLALSHRVIPISDGRTIGSVPARDIDEEQLTLLCAPRSSLARQEMLLRDISLQFNSQAAWIIQAGDQILCLSRQGYSSQLNFALPDPGSVVLKRDTAISAALCGLRGKVATEPQGHQSLIFTIENLRGHDLGCIAIVCDQKPEALNSSAIENFIKLQLAQFEEGQFRLRLDIAELSTQ